MGTISSGGKIAVMKVDHGIEVTTYRDELDAVMQMIDNGTLGKGCSYGDEAHLLALDHVEQHIAEVREKIWAQNEEPSP